MVLASQAGHDVSGGFERMRERVRDHGALVATGTNRKVDPGEVLEPTRANPTQW